MENTVDGIQSNITSQTESKESKKLKILCLHGYYNNTTVMQYQLSYYEHIFKDAVEFVYLQGIHPCTEVYDKSIYEKFQGQKFYGWVDISLKKKEDMFATLLESTKYVVDYINSNGPFDGILTFSQAHYIPRGILKANELPFEVDQPKIMPSFCILMSAGFFFPNMFDALETKYDVPILYIHGTNDHSLLFEKAIVKEGDYTIIEHDKGHSIPKLIGDKMKVFIDFISRQYVQKFGEEPKIFREIDEKYREKYIESHLTSGTKHRARL